MAMDHSMEVGMDIFHLVPTPMGVVKNEIFLGYEGQNAGNEDGAYEYSEN